MANTLEVKISEMYIVGNIEKALEEVTKHHKIADIDMWTDAKVYNNDGSVRHEKASTRIWQDDEIATAMTNVEINPDASKSIYEVYSCKIVNSNIAISKSN